MKLKNKFFLKLGGLMAAFLFTMLAPGVSQAVPAGWDFFHTDTSTSFNGISFQGVPIGTCSGNCGNIPDGTYVGNADTIVQRLDNVTTDGGLTGLAIQALQLVSLNPFGNGENLYVTLDATQPAPPPSPPIVVGPNTMQIFGATGGSGTFNSYLDFNVDFYASSSIPANFNFTNPASTGTLVNSMFNGGNGATPVEIQLTALNVAWSSTPPLAAAGSSTCPPFYILYHGECHGVNQDGVPVVTINGVPQDNFNPEPFYERVPEPSTFALFGIGLALLGYSRRKTAFQSNMAPA